MSMGSIVQAHKLSPTVKEGFLKAFSKLKQRILWKWEADFPKAPPNLMTVRWLPQSDVLSK